MGFIWNITSRPTVLEANVHNITGVVSRSTSIITAFQTRQLMAGNVQ